MSLRYSRQPDSALAASAIFPYSVAPIGGFAESCSQTILNWQKRTFGLRLSHQFLNPHGASSGFHMPQGGLVQPHSLGRWARSWTNSEIRRKAMLKRISSSHTRSKASSMDQKEEEK
ncbi:unnamed protein product [Protopolystoma xenopodis]|uniref:Uncharacterized protein n=1 Tax=Protopolystoma xenopodis TaxID=117903 RepID=A0A3S5APX8_9PLAT|nr:unnamed protein product [Protopolystoma xenopodis]